MPTSVGPVDCAGISSHRKHSPVGLFIPQELKVEERARNNVSCYLDIPRGLLRTRPERSCRLRSSRWSLRAEINLQAQPRVNGDPASGFASIYQHQPEIQSLWRLAPVGRSKRAKE